MTALIACEYSGIVRDAFENTGVWDAWSCDLLPTESEQTRLSGKHFQCDVLEVLNQNWDLLIAFPPCTYLTYAGMSTWYDDGRAMKRIEAAKFFMQLYESNIKHICIENPRGILTKIFRKPDMEIHPYYFGEKEMKRTCLWLKNLPILKYSLCNTLFENQTSTLKPEPIIIQYRRVTGEVKKRYRTEYLFRNNKDRAKERSRFWPSIAQAMATQWTEFILNNK